MPNVVDLALCADARRALHRVLSERGLDFFVHRGRPPRLDPRRIAWVVEAARRSSSAAGRRRVPDPDAVPRARRLLRRELIRRMAERLVMAGL